MNEITKEILKEVSDYNGGDYQFAYNIREDGCCVGRQSTEHIKIENKEDAPGLVIRILPGTKDERVSIPACVTHGNVDDVVYNDFYVGEGITTKDISKLISPVVYVLKNEKISELMRRLQKNKTE